MEKKRRENHRLAAPPMLCLLLNGGNGGSGGTYFTGRSENAPRGTPGSFAFEAVDRVSSRAAKYNAAFRKTILIFEDDETFAELLEQSFSSEAAFKVVVFHDSSRPLEKVRQHRPDLIILDLNLPPNDGWTVIKILRQDKTLPPTPVIIMSGCYKKPSDVISGLDFFGADDYVIKPFPPEILVARAKAVMRRACPDIFAHRWPGRRDIVLGVFKINSDSHEVFASGVRVDLTPTEYGVLLYLLKNRGRVCHRDEIINNACPNREDAFSRIVDRHISEIRRKLGRHGRCIRAVFGSGYIIEEPSDE